MRVLVLALAAIIGITANLAFWYLPNRPAALDHVWTGGPLQSASFAPFRRGQSPLTQTFATPAQIEADIAALRGKVGGVRTYTAREGLDVVPKIAGKYGLTVTQGAWLGRDRAINEAEVLAVIHLANTYPDTIKRVIVGNEVLLRGELSPAEIAGYIRRVKQAVKQPVSYADVWEFWLRHPELAAEVDYVTVHFLPYWEDDPVGVEHSMDHIVAVHDIVAKAFPGRPILIGEVGWPSAGRSREDAVPGRWMEAEFLNAFALLAARRGLDYNIVEAFDQPWKSAHEGTMGANWGLIDADRHDKFPLQGPVVENPHWRTAFAGAALFGLLATLWALRVPLTPAQGAAVALFGHALGAMLAASAQFGLATWHDRNWYAAPLLQFVLQAVLAVLLLRELLQRLEGPAEPVPVLSPAVALGEWKITTWRDRLLGIFVLLATYETLWLALRIDLPALREPLKEVPGKVVYWLHWMFNGRYRDFPIPEFLVPALGFGLMLVILALFGRRPRAVGAEAPASDRLLAALLVLGVVLLQWVERFQNREAMYWGLLALLLATLPALSLRRAIAR